MKNGDRVNWSGRAGKIVSVSNSFKSSGWCAVRFPGDASAVQFDRSDLYRVAVDEWSVMPRPGDMIYTRDGKSGLMVDRISPTQVRVLVCGELQEWMRMDIDKIIPSEDILM